MRKFLAIFLAVAMLASFAVVPAFADAGDALKIKSVPKAPFTDADAIEYTGKTATLTDDASFQIWEGDTKLAAAPTDVKIAGAASIAATGQNDGTIDVAFTNPSKDDTAVVTVTVGSGVTAQSAFIIIKYGDDPQTGDLKAFTIKAPASPLVVEDNELALELEKTPKNSLTAITWFSSDNTIATVTAGKVKGVKEGKVTITAVSQNGLVQKIDLIVVKGVAPTAISFGAGSYEVGDTVDSKVTLGYTIAPANGKQTKLTLKVTDGATVLTDGTDYTFDKASGEFKVKKASAFTAPKALILELSVGDTGAEKKAYATLVTKVGASTGVVEVTIDNATSPLTLGVDQKFQIKATGWDMAYEKRDAKPVANAKIEYVSSNTAVATVDKDTGVVTAVAKGAATIYATVAGATKNASIVLDVVDKIEGTFAYVKAASVKVRALPSSSSIELDTYKNGQRVTVVEVLGAWTKIKFSNSEAYVASSALITPTDFVVTSSKLNVRAFIGAKEAVKVLNFGDKVQFVGLDANNKAWAKVLINNSEYYVAAANITEGPLTGVVLSGTLTFRVGASATSAAYANKLVKGQVVEVIGREGAFLKVKTAEGFVGYAAAAYITIL